MDQHVLLGDEAVALGAVHAGISAAYGYPGTPSTEILESLIEMSKKAAATGTASATGAANAPFTAAWCANEKTACEAALGTSFAGRRAIVTMKHVGLNVAADPFINASVLKLGGGLVIAVADDPGMHSSQDEQDSRSYADFAMVPCLEPASQQEAYTMTREAFELSERWGVPVILRLVTRLSHSRAVVTLDAPRGQNAVRKSPQASDWMLLPAYARRNYARLCDNQAAMETWSASSPLNRWTPNPGFADFGVITGGLGLDYYEEILPELEKLLGGKPSHLHVGAYPAPLSRARELFTNVKQVLVMEEGQPVLEKMLRGLWRDDSGVKAAASFAATGSGQSGAATEGANAAPRPLAVRGKLDGTLPRAGELNPDLVRAALGVLVPALKPLPLRAVPELANTQRPPQLCQGCPHGDSYSSLKQALQELSGGDSSRYAVNADIGCYALGALPPYSAIESIVCMGASIGMARGAAEAGIPYAVAVIGDSTFYHSGLTPLIDAVSAKAPITVLILDNSIVAMTGCQPTILPEDRLCEVVKGIGVEPEHVVVIDTKPGKVAENAAILKKEIAYRGVSVVIARRECLEAFRLRKKEEKK